MVLYLFIGEVSVSGGFSQKFGGGGGIIFIFYRLGFVDMVGLIVYGGFGGERGGVVGFIILIQGDLFIKYIQVSTL